MSWFRFFVPFCSDEVYDLMIEMPAVLLGCLA